MNRIIRGAAIVLAVLASAAAAAQAPRPRPDAAALRAVLDPSVTLASIDEAVNAGAESTIPAGRFFLLTGRMGKLVDRSPEDEDTFIGEAELTGGAWIGLEEIRSYHAFLSFKGDAFYAMADRSDPSYIKPGSMVMVIGWYVGKKLSYGEGAKKQMAIIEVERIVPIE